MTNMHRTVPLITIDTDGATVPYPLLDHVETFEPYYYPEAAEYTCGGYGGPECEGTNADDDVKMPRGQESDTPDHCLGCGVLLDQSMTSHGKAYVADAVRECVDEGERNPVVDVWIVAYDYALDDVPELVESYAALSATSSFWIEGHGRNLARLAGWTVLEN